MLVGTHILLGITGGIAAYKTTFLIRLLIKAGAEVKVILTESAASFVSPLTLTTLSRNPVLLNFVREEGETVAWNNHVVLGLWADLMLVAPATANTMAKMAAGQCDNLLLATYLSAKCPVYFAPSMDLDMYKHPATLASIEKLQANANILIPAEEGELASGLEGEGRMAEPENIVKFICDHITASLPLKDKKVLITAGPTQEAIDPVRFIGNHSTGLMGFELAREACRLGAQVVLISGPTHLAPGGYPIQLRRVVSGEEMYQAVQEEYPDSDIVIFAAAVADFRPLDRAKTKIKKESDSFNLQLVRTRDILQSLGKIKQHQFLVGFALETENETENAKGKLKKKNLDAIVLNSLRDQGAGFGGPDNKISFIDKNLTIKTFELKTKAKVAEDILQEIITRLHD